MDAEYEVALLFKYESIYRDSLIEAYTRLFNTVDGLDLCRLMPHNVYRKQRPPEEINEITVFCADVAVYDFSENIHEKERQIEQLMLIVLPSTVDMKMEYINAWNQED